MKQREQPLPAFPAGAPEQAARRTASVALARRVQRRAQSAGIGLNEFCALTGIHAEELEQPDRRVDAIRFRRVKEVFRQCLLESPRSAGGGPGDTHALFDDLPRLAGLWFNSASLGAALAGFATYRRVLGEFDELHWRSVGDTIEMTYIPEERDSIGLSSAIGNFALLKQLVDHYLDDASHTSRPGGRVRVEVELALAPGTVRARLEDALGLTLRTGPAVQSHRLVVHGDNLWLPVERFNPLLNERARRELDRELGRLDARPSLVSRVGEQIERVWSCGRDLPGPSGLLQETAERLCMSRWTLRRHLAEEGLSFQQVLDDLRSRKAQALLPDRNLSMLEISQRLGFASQGSFNRFFRMRFDCAPGQARRAAMPCRPAR